ncbi:MAG: lipoyl domain-containing protein [Planctomycetota bacterium]|nr:lipoyl domain-containing protein [Planctomycetota bacterium]
MSLLKWVKSNVAALMSEGPVVVHTLDSDGIFAAPELWDPISRRTAPRGKVLAWHVELGRSMVAGQKILDVQTEIGVIPIRTKTNGYLVEILAPVGKDIAPGMPLWRSAVSKPMK